MPILEGGCQCGAIRYEVLGAPVRLVICHCTDCQRQSSSAFGMTMVVHEEDFRLKKRGTENLRFEVRCRESETRRVLP